MTSLLLVEDDEQKVLHISAFVEEFFPEFHLTVKRSFQSGLKHVVSKPPTLLLLDMTLTTFDLGQDEEGGRPRLYGGREILEHMDEYGIAVPSIIVTQYSAFGDRSAPMLTLADLDQQLLASFPEIYRGIVYYQVSTESWKSRLREKIQEIVKGG